MNERPLKLPLRAVAINITGAILCAVGVNRLMLDESPSWQMTSFGLVLLVVGAVLMLYGLVVILGRIVAASRDSRAR